MSTHEYAIQAYSWVVNTNVLMGITISPKRTSAADFPTQRFIFVLTEMFSYTSQEQRCFSYSAILFRTHRNVFVLTRLDP